jgi:choline dehydrogenase-like flavoprotein
MPLTTENTTFTRDVYGRYTCNTFEEAVASTDRAGGGAPFDVIVIGGGSFGGVIAHRLFSLDQRTRQHRILVLEAGPLLLTEHIQNIPPMLADVMQEVRRVPWTAPANLGLQFPGLAECAAGRSLFWGGWSPQLTDSELGDWPQPVANDLKNVYFAEAKRQIGTDTTNEFIFGPLHEALKKNLWDNIGLVADRFEIADADQLEAPLAVASAASRGGIFPANKFSSMQLLMDATRKAFAESGGDDRRKRLMLVPNCAVTGLSITDSVVSGIVTTRGTLALPQGGQVILANGTIESARLALASFPNPHNLIGRNLMAHVRTNYVIRIPRQDLALPLDRLYASALFVKCRNAKGHYHFQITASAPGPNVADSEAELFKKVPGIDELDFLDLGDENVDIVIRGIGEMPADRSAASVNRVELTDGSTQVAGRVANVFLSPADLTFADDLITASKQIARALAAGKPYEERNVTKDNLGSTHHEAGTLWMGTDAADSVTDIWGRFHEVPNAWAAGPALFPSVGSPNPMLTGVALARRTAERMFEAPIADPARGPVTLFNGTNLDGWQHVGAGRFVIDAGNLVTDGGLGVLWYTPLQFRNFRLTVEWRVTKTSDNGGVFVRLPNPAGDANVPIIAGYEIQIDDEGAPDGADIHKTGSIYGVRGPLTAASKAPGEWNTFVIEVTNQTYNVTLNDQKVITDFAGNRSRRGHIGLQNHLPGDQVAYRNIVATPL